MGTQLVQPHGASLWDWRSARIGVQDCSRPAAQHALVHVLSLGLAVPLTRPLPELCTGKAGTRFDSHNKVCGLGVGEGVGEGVGVSEGVGEGVRVG